MILIGRWTRIAGKIWNDQLHLIVVTHPIGRDVASSTGNACRETAQESLVKGAMPMITNGKNTLYKSKSLISNRPDPAHRTGTRLRKNARVSVNAIIYASSGPAKTPGGSNGPENGFHDGTCRACPCFPCDKIPVAECIIERYGDR